MKKLLIILTILGLIGCVGKHPLSEDTLIMGTSLDYPPFEYSELGQAKGMDIEIAREIAHEMGYRLEIRDMGFEGLFGALNAGTIDFIMAGLSWTEERARNVDFSDPYFKAESSLVLLVKKGNVSGVKTLEGKRIGAQQGSVMEASLMNQGDVEVLALSRNPQLIEELKLGRIDGVLIEKLQAEAYMKANGDALEIAPFPYSLGNADVCAVFKKGSHLRDRFNQALKKLEESKKLDSIREEWLK